MKANHQSKTGDVAQPYFKQRRFLGEARGGQPGPGRRRRSQRVMMILAIVGAVLFLWVQPVAAAPTITEFHVSHVGVPQGITAGPDGNLWFTEFYNNVIGPITPQRKSTLFMLNPTNSPTDITHPSNEPPAVTLLHPI